ncbi:MAG: hypothetical protein OEV36_04165 [Myxococcales bacterium]|nr:hypothetical protein [Myxococcales bacterium]
MAEIRLLLYRTHEALNKTPVLVSDARERHRLDGGGGWGMKKRQIFWAFVFSSMLAIGGCGDENTGSGGSGGSGGTAGSGGTGGTGGGSSSGFCGTLCAACGGDQVAQCASSCESQTADLGGTINLDRCPSQAEAWGACLGANGCNSNACSSQITAWATCIVTP